MSYRNLEIWLLARETVVEIHGMTLNKLPKFEMFEEGSQIRRSSKSVKSNIVEGYGRRRYKQEFIRFLTCAGSLKDQSFYDQLHDKLLILGRKISNFIDSVERGHRSER